MERGTPTRAAASGRRWFTSSDQFADHHQRSRRFGREWPTCLAFISTLSPAFVANEVVATIFGALMAGACLVGIGRMIRRMTVAHMRLISTPDDYFSLFMLICWFGLGTVTQAFVAGWIELDSLTVLVALPLSDQFLPPLRPVLEDLSLPLLRRRRRQDADGEFDLHDARLPQVRQARVRQEQEPGQIHLPRLLQPGPQLRHH